MKPLAKTFSKNGFTYEEVIRQGDIAIYKQRLRPGAGELAFEVFRVNKNEERKMGGAVIPAAESGPSNEQFGASAWSYPELGRAKAKFAELVKAAAQKAEKASLARP